MASMRVFHICPKCGFEHRLMTHKCKSCGFEEWTSGYVTVAEWLTQGWIITVLDVGILKMHELAFWIIALSIAYFVYRATRERWVGNVPIAV